MLCRLLRKYSAFFAGLAVLCACVAAPYLAPIDPDSAAFRSGAFPFLLLTACFFPLRAVLRRISPRTLAPCLCWGFALACALSLGAELSFYGGLLPGAKSLLRRACVPLLATPLLCGLCALLALHKPLGGRSLRLPALAWFGLFLLAWLPVLLAYWPGMLNYDFLTERWCYTDKIYSKRNPLLYFFVNNFLLSLGTNAGRPNAGLLLSSLAHMIPFAAALAYACAFLQKRKAPRAAMLVLLLLYALHPMFSVMSVSQSKDVPFTAALLVLSLLSWEMMEDADAFFASRAKRIAFLLAVFGTVHMRKNGIAALLFLFPALLASLKGRRLQMLRLALVSTAVSVAGLLAFELLPLDRQPYFQWLSVPAQQLVRAYNSGKLTEEEREEIRSWYYDDYGLVLIPQLADGAKGYLKEEKLEPELMDYARLWLRIGQKCPQEYLEAFLFLNLGSWYPDDATHAAIYANTGASQKGYLELNEYVSQEFSPTTLLPRVQDFYEAVCRYREYRKWPIVSLLFAIAMPFWALLLACCILRARGLGRMTAAAYGVLGVWASYIFGPCALPRYSLPLFALAPPLLILALMQRRAD